MRTDHRRGLNSDSESGLVLSPLRCSLSQGYCLCCSGSRDRCGWWLVCQCAWAWLAHMWMFCSFPGYRVKFHKS